MTGDELKGMGTFILFFILPSPSFVSFLSKKIDTHSLVEQKPWWFSIIRIEFLDLRAFRTWEANKLLLTTDQVVSSDR
ncbi:unnamed protein product [Rhodiola kirilowii]